MPRLGDRLERRQRPRRDRAREAAVDEGGPRARPRPEVVVDLDPAAASRAASIRHVTSMPFGRAALVDESQPERPARRSTSAPATRPAATSPSAGSERPPGDQLRRRARRRPSRRDRPDRDVVGEQPRPALDVAGQPEDELRPARRRRSRSCSSSRLGPGRSSPTAYRASSTSRIVGEVVAGRTSAHVSVEPSTSSRSSPPTIRDSVDDAEEVEVGALGEPATVGRRGRRRPRSPRSRRRARSPRASSRMAAASGCSPKSTPPPGSVQAPTSTSIADSRASRIRPSSSSTDRIRAEACSAAAAVPIP